MSDGQTTTMRDYAPLKRSAVDRSLFRRRIKFALRNAVAAALLPLAKIENRFSRWVAILSYHRILPDFPAGSSRTANVDPVDFEKQVEYLQNENFAILSLDEFYRIHTGEIPAPDRAAMITFDDGYADNLLTAHEIGRRRSVPINYFIPTGIIGLTEWPFHWGERTPQEVWHINQYPELWRPLRWHEVHQMRNEGAHFGLHGYIHKRLSRLTRVELEEEIDCGAAEYEKHMEECSRSFSIPWGDGSAYTPDAIEVLRARGFKMIFTTLPSRTRLPCQSDIFPRISIREHDDLASFSRKIQGAHDLLYRFCLASAGRTP